MHDAMPAGRRKVLSGLGLLLASPGLAAPALAAPALAAPALAATALAAPETAQGEMPSTIMVAGPAGGRLDRWADLMSAPIGRALAGRALTRQNVGGIDGVTGANQFEARNEPDGSTALLVPGSAALVWLVGEMRARFDPARWVPLWAQAGSAVLVSRIAVTEGRRVRVAASSLVGQELPFFLALDMLGMDATPSTFATSEAMLLQGAALPTSITKMGQVGFQPIMTLGALNTEAQSIRDPLLPTVPTALELVQGRGPPDLVAALRATALAVQLDAGLVLPALTPAASVAQWRRACSSLFQDADIQREAARLGARPISAAAAATCTAGIAGDPATLLALRGWLATRHSWRAP